SKLDRSAPARLASLAEITTLFTDRPLPPGLAQKCAEWGTTVVVAAPDVRPPAPVPTSERAP
ncbi:MAG: hypothetical protein LPJ93_15090, partial [Rhodobacterales bacterium]|nr:hypothetical protein [Rhodobacterales bacterium]